MNKQDCEHYNKISCPDNCTYWECEDFRPTDYFMSGIKELKEVYKKWLKLDKTR